MTDRNTVVLVDEQDNYLGVDDKTSAHQQGRLHRAFSVMLYRKNLSTHQIEFLLQQRAKGKYHCGGLWTNSCCSHPGADEDIIDSAIIRLQDELGDINTEALNLINIGSFIYKANFSNGLTEYEYDHVLLSEYNETPNNYNLNEVEDIAWLSIEDILTKYKINKSSFTPWFKQVFDISHNWVSGS